MIIQKCACQKSYTSIIMTSITWAGPRYVQELGTFSGSQNRTQRGCVPLFRDVRMPVNIPRVVEMLECLSIWLHLSRCECQPPILQSTSGTVQHCTVLYCTLYMLGMAILDRIQSEWEKRKGRLLILASGVRNDRLSNKYVGCDCYYVVICGLNGIMLMLLSTKVL